MLTKFELTDLFDRIGTPPAGRTMIDRARACAPVRDVQSRGGNVITLLASRKMGKEVRTESRHIEFAAAVNHEYDTAVLEYYAQPCELKLELIDDASGEIRSIQHFPDFLVIRQDSITLEEWKSQDKLERLAQRFPYRYQRGSDGLWHSPQIERQLAELGIRYRIYSDKAIPRKRVENLLHLADYFHPATPPCPDTTVDRLHAVLREHGAVYLSELLARPFCFDADELNKAIADQLVEVDLDREALTQPTRARLYRDATLREFLEADIKAGQIPGQQSFVIDIAPGAVFSFESQKFTISLVGEADFVCTVDDGSTRTLSRDWLLEAVEKQRVQPIEGITPANLNLSRYSENDLKIAANRSVMLHSTSAPVSDRTLRRWSARQHAAIELHFREVLGHGAGAFQEQAIGHVKAVGLVDGGDLFPAGHGQLESALRDAHAAVAGNLAHGQRHVGAGHHLAPATVHVAVHIKAFGGLAHDDQVHGLACAHIGGYSSRCAVDGAPSFLMALSTSAAISLERSIRLTCSMTALSISIAGTIGSPEVPAAAPQPSTCPFSLRR